MFAFTDGDRWHLGIGDPTVMGWLTVMAYLAAAVLCIHQMFRSIGQQRSRQELVFWSILSGVMLFLGINKQLDLQTLLTLTVRRLAIAQGWYRERKIVQAVFVVLIGLAGLVSFFAMRKLVRNQSLLRLPLIGFLLLLCFVFMRAASFHHFDRLINFRMSGVRMNWVLELGAIGVVAVGAWKRESIVKGSEPDQPSGARLIATSRRN